MPHLNLTELEAALEKATPGPWELAEENEHRTIYGAGGEFCCASDECRSSDNAEAIVLLRNQAPAILAELKALRKAVEGYQGMELVDLTIQGNPTESLHMRAQRDAITAKLNEELGKV